MKRYKKQFVQRDPEAAKEETQQKAYLFAGLMILGVIVVALISAAVHRSHAGRPVIGNGPDYATDCVTMWSGAAIPSPYSFLYARTSFLVDTARYAEIPDTAVGDHDVAILIHLKDGTTRTENAVLSVKEPVMHMEVGTIATPEQLLGSAFAGATVEPPLTSFPQIGIYSVTVTLNGNAIPFKLNVQDTTPPVATFKENLSFFVNQELTAEDFVETCSDMSPVEFHFSEPPSTISQGMHDIQMVITDAAGNSQTYDLQYSVSGDGLAPKINGVMDMQTIAGVPIDYMRGIQAMDSNDGLVEVTVSEPAGFNINTPGTYIITYTSTDSAGNTANENANLTVLSTYDGSVLLSSEDVMRMGDYIIHELEKTNQIIDQKAFARAIFDYVKSHLNYVNRNQTGDWQTAAVDALTLGYGDSANYYGLSRLLLTCAGYDNMMVERHSGKTEEQDDEEEEKVPVWYEAHFWNLVRVNGAWYHFDASPYHGGNDFFLWTDAQIDYFSSLNGNCFERDKSLYPLTPG